MERLTVSALKELCRDRGLPVGGTKATLIARLAATETAKQENDGDTAFALLDLPHELLTVEVILRLSVREIISLSDVCTTLRTILIDKAFLKPLFETSNISNADKGLLLEFMARLGYADLFREMVGDKEIYDSIILNNCRRFLGEGGVMEVKLPLRWSRLELFKTEKSWWTGLKELGILIKSQYWIAAKAAVSSLVGPFEHDMVYLGRLLRRLLTNDDLKQLLGQIKGNNTLRTIIYAVMAAYTTDRQYERLTDLLKSIPTKQQTPYCKLIYEYIDPYGVDRMGESLKRPPLLSCVRNRALFDQYYNNKSGRDLIYSCYLVMTPEEASTFVEKKRSTLDMMKREDRMIDRKLNRIYRTADREGYTAWAESYRMIPIKKNA